MITYDEVRECMVENKSYRVPSRYLDRKCFGGLMESQHERIVDESNHDHGVMIRLDGAGVIWSYSKLWDIGNGFVVADVMLHPDGQDRYCNHREFSYIVGYSSEYTLWLAASYLLSKLGEEPELK